ncbi:MAG: thermonuclease family protein [Alphaproteobacteria bacterium]|nr:thermonuclease family protein [Alphaproteobacteria bacterium]
MTLPRLIFVLLVASSAVGTAAAQSPVVGVASVIDGDTLDIQGRRIRLHGIDAPESGQFCEKEGKQYRCGQQAALALSDKIGQATVRCEQLDIDRYKRIVAVCRLGNIELNAWMVRQGWAIAYRRYSRDYIDDEGTAQVAKAGIWAGRFIEPSRWRRGERLTAESTSGPAGDACQIKGNISRSGDRIYHMPAGRDYGPTRIDESRGERWFCSEDEARKAGWRRSRQ